VNQGKRFFIKFDRRVIFLQKRTLLRTDETSKEK